MSKGFALTLVLVFLTASCVMVAKPVSGASAVGNSWVEKASMHQARAGLGVVAVNDKIYAIGGSNASGLYPPDIQGFGFLATNEQYDIATDTWSFKSPMPTPRDYFAIAAYQNKIYCIGGAVGITTDQTTLLSSYTESGVNEVYDTTTDKWETKAPMPVSGMYLQANVVNGKIFVMGVGLTYVYDLATDSWSNKTAMPFTPPPGSGSYPSSAAIGDKIFVTGEFQIGTFPSEEKVLIYDTETDSWSQGTSGTAIIIDGAAGATTGMAAPQRIYALGLVRGVPPSPVNQVYNPKSDTWTTATAMPTLHMDFAVAVVNDTLYAIGGYTISNAVSNYVTPTGVNEQYMPIAYGTPDPSYVQETTPPKISLLSPLNQTYNESSVPLVFKLDKAVNWTDYSLDGRQNVTITGNCTIPNMTNGLHNITVYANDTFGNIGASETISFTIAKPEPFPTATVAAVSGAIAVVVVAGLLVYHKKRKR